MATTGAATLARIGWVLTGVRRQDGNGTAGKGWEGMDGPRMVGAVMAGGERTG